jgi:HK97 gp10 family phage protein
MRPAAGGGFFVEAAGFEEAGAFFSKLQHELKQGMRGRLREAAEVVKGAAQEETHSARVRSGMTISVNVKSLTEFSARIGPSRRRAWFAHFLEFGTGPHMQQKAVREGFVGPAAPFSHPGSRAFPFLAPALARTADEVTEIVGFPPILQHGGK